LAKVEVDEMLGLVCHVASEVAADDAVPCRIVFLVELLLDIGGNVLFNVVLFERLGGTVDSILLHVLRHVGILDNRLSVRHLGTVNKNKPQFNCRCQRMDGLRVVLATLT